MKMSEMDSNSNKTITKEKGKEQEKNILMRFDFLDRKQMNASINPWNYEND